MNTRRLINHQIRAAGAVIEGDHFVLGSPDGAHTSTFVNEAKIFTNRSLLLLIAGFFAIRIPGTTNLVVVLPEHEGLIPYLSGRMRVLRNTHLPPEFVCLGRTDRGELFVPTDKISLVRTEYAALVSVVLYDEPSIDSFRAIDAILSAGGVVDRNYPIWNGTYERTVKGMDTGIDPLTTDYIATYGASECPMCESGFPVNTQFGYGAAFEKNAKMMEDKVQVPQSTEDD